MARRVDMRRLDVLHQLADEADDAFEEWETAQLPTEWWDYPCDFPVVSRLSPAAYRTQFRRSQQVTVCSMSTAHG